MNNKRNGFHRRKSHLHSLTERELCVLRLLACGLENAGIGHRLGIAEKTVRYHTDNLYAKLGVHDRTNAALWALRNGVISVDEAWAVVENERTSGMNSINVGDRVQWQERHVSRPYLHTEIGTVTSLMGEYAEVLCDYGFDIVPKVWLSKVSAIEAVADDYEFALRVVGDLSGAEL